MHLQSTSKPETKSHNPDYLEIVSYATKAPSGHNTQPWKFRLYESAIEILPNLNHSLPVVDGNNRELYISLGCALENLCVAAIEKGYKPSSNINKVSNGVYTILVKLEKDQLIPNRLFSAIEKRQTNRSVYKQQRIALETIERIQQIECEPGTQFFLHSNGSDIFQALSQFIYRGNEIQMKDQAFKKELLSWIRFNKKQAGNTQNGLTNAVMGTPSTPAFVGKLIVNSFLNPSSQNKTDRKKLESSSHLALFTTEQDTPEQWILLGRTLERFLLETTLLGIANAHLNPPCEIRILAEEIQNTITNNKEYPTILLRIGYANLMPYSPRQSVKSVLLS